MVNISSLRLELVGLFILLLISAFFSGAETAFLSCRRIRMRHLLEEGNKKAGIILKLMKEPEKVVASLVIGNNIVNVAASAIATSIAINLFGNKGIGIAIGVMTFLILIVGEITPKGIAVNNAERISLTFASFMYYFAKALSPVAAGLTVISRAFIRISGNKKDRNPLITEGEFRTFLTIAAEEGSLEEEERERISNVVAFSDTLAREVMTPRTDMVCIDANSTLEEARDVAVKTGRSRIPVYEENVDHVIGILYAKDLLRHSEGNLRAILRTPYFIPETKGVDELLKEMQRDKIHLAIAVDEYGGTAGIVTIEDVLEEIVGEIFDEYDTASVPIRKIDEETFLINGVVSIDEVNQVLSIAIPENEVESIGGFILEQMGRIPKEGEKITFDGVDFTVFKTDGVRIMKVRAKKPSAEKREKA